MTKMNALTVDDSTVEKLQAAGFLPVIRWVRPAKSSRVYKTAEALAAIEPKQCDATFTGDRCTRKKGHTGMHQHGLPDGGTYSWRDKHVLRPKTKAASRKKEARK